MTERYKYGGHTFIFTIKEVGQRWKAEGNADNNPDVIVVTDTFATRQEGREAFWKQAREFSGSQSHG